MAQSGVVVLAADFFALGFGEAFLTTFFFAGAFRAVDRVFVALACFAIEYFLQFA